MLWFGIGSSGKPPRRYTLQVPFQLAEHQAVQMDQNKICVSLGELAAELHHDRGVYYLRVLNFPSALEAEAFLPRVHGSLLRLAVKKRLGLRIGLPLQEAQIYDPPIDVRGNPNFGDLFEKAGWTHIDGAIDQFPAVVIPEHLRLMLFGAGTGSVLLTMPLGHFITTLQEGLNLPAPEALASDDRLVLAIDVYGSSQHENSSRAKLVTLVTALEALVDRERASEEVILHVDRILEFLRNQRKGAHLAGPQHELDRLQSRIGNLKKEGFRERLARLVVEEAGALREDPSTLVDKMNEAYDTRSRLLHDGIANQVAIQRSASWLNQAVPTILDSYVERRMAPK